MAWPRSEDFEILRRGVRPERFLTGSSHCAQRDERDKQPRERKRTMKWIHELMFKNAVAKATSKRSAASRNVVEIQADSPILSVIVGGGIDGSG